MARWLILVCSVCKPRQRNVLCYVRCTLVKWNALNIKNIRNLYQNGCKYVSCKNGQKVQVLGRPLNYLIEFVRVEVNPVIVRCWVAYVKQWQNSIARYNPFVCWGACILFHVHLGNNMNSAHMNILFVIMEYPLAWVWGEQQVEDDARKGSTRKCNAYTIQLLMAECNLRGSRRWVQQPTMP